jgi:AcrR family transcriptional regulator
VATLNVIRRWALRDQMSIREISRRTGLARNTVKKHLRSEESEPKYPRRVSSSKLDPYAEKLATWLVIEATKSRKQRRTLRQIHTDSAQKGENQELIHIVSTFCSQRVWVNIRWKTRVRLQRNSTPTPGNATTGNSKPLLPSRPQLTGCTSGMPSSSWSSGEELRPPQVRGLQDLLGVAVVDFQDGGAARRLDAHALEAELAALALAVDGFCALSYSTSRLLVSGSTICVTSLSHSGLKSWPSSISTAWYWPPGICWRSTPRMTLSTISIEHGVAPARHRLPKGHSCWRHHLWKLRACTRSARPLACEHRFELHGQRLVVAKHEDGLGRRQLGQVLGAVAQDHGLARAGHAVDHAVALAQAAGQLLLLQVHHAHDVRQVVGSSLRTGRPASARAPRGT